MKVGSPRRVAIAISLVCATTACNSETSVELDRETITDATMRVRAQGCGPRTELGTGTTIADGLVVTAAHVVAGAQHVEVVDHLGVTSAAEVVLFDPALDVAALRPDSPAGPPVALRTERGAEGEAGLVGLLAIDGSVELTAIDVVQRVTIRTTDIYRDDAVERPGLRVTVSIEPGDSGSMVHLPGGGVGIVWSRSRSVDDQAWTVDLPTELLDESARRTLVEPVDVGPCP